MRSHNVAEERGGNDGCVCVCVRTDHVEEEEDRQSKREMTNEGMAETKSSQPHAHTRTQADILDLFRTIPFNSVRPVVFVVSFCLIPLTLTVLAVGGVDPVVPLPTPPTPPPVAEEATVALTGAGPRRGGTEGTRGVVRDTNLSARRAVAVGGWRRIEILHQPNSRNDVTTTTHLTALPAPVN